MEVLSILKRTMDFCVSLVVLLIVSPLFLVLALVIKLDSPGPVLYRGPRVGRDGRNFNMLKFRSMVRAADQKGPSSTSAADSRITRSGHFIRKYKLDELAQLLNVLKGDMSLVGPRPQVQWAVDLYSREERRVLDLRPGITDWASIRFRNEGEIIANSGIQDPDDAYMKLIHPEKMRLQLLYYEQRSMLTDLSIIYNTLGSLLLPARFEINNQGRIEDGKQ